MSKQDDNPHSTPMLESKPNGLVLTKEDLQRSKEQQRRKEEADARKLVLEAKAKSMEAEIKQRRERSEAYAARSEMGWDVAQQMAHFPPPRARHELLRDMQVFEGHPSMDEVEIFRLAQIRVPREVPAAVPLSAKAVAMDEMSSYKVIWVGPGDYRHPYYRHHRR